ncbi:MULTISPECIES: CaiB/BaiF CoA transferase family protein [Pseudomonas]|uniref:CaiB/BaiF CoA transferase family protein n=4 Tax=Pseudomonas TaxID=286 RepID=UPI001F2EBD02|nr:MULTISPECIES: CoA transferase [Pseudomonas]MCF5517508.1 CoA transferase [Pseudomonas sp. PA-3-6E]MCF5564833.1 CoA transferase [Pseudomonas sp. PA-3-5D]MCF5567892.1 CoA transferase [Pseudomonas sp. PA-3-11C]MCT9828125.1 CoA transferase [Pseudomonas veronii]
MTTNKNHLLPLDGVRVLDLSRVLAGPWCTQILGDFGADVSKIEMLGVGDDTRGWGPPFLPSDDDATAGSGESAYYLGCNRSKRSVAVDMGTPEGAALIKRMAAEADVLVENFRVGGLKKFGLDYESLRELNPRLVYCSITGFGQDGPYADRGGYDFVAQAMGGLMSITGDKNGESTKVGVAITDLSTGIYATISVLLALRHAEATGIGQHIDCSLLDTQMSLLANQAMSWLVGGIVPGRMGNAHPTVVPYRTFEAQDGSLVVAVGNDSQFRALCQAIERPDLSADPRYIRNADRVSNRDTLEQELQIIFGQWQRSALIDLLVEAKVPAGPVNNIDQVFQDPFIEARKVVHRFTRDDGVSVPTLAFPGKLSATPPDYRLPPPRLGEHTFEVLRDWLKMTPDDLEQLAKQKVIADRSGS